MKILRVLFLSPHFHPEKISTGKYNSLLVKGLLDRGAAVQVIASHPFYPSWEPVRSEERFFAASIHRGGDWLRYPSRPLLRRILLEVWFSWHSFWKTLSLKENVDLAVLVFPPNLYGLFVRLLLPRSIRKIGIIHDLQAILSLNGQSSPGRALNRVVHAIEKKAFQSCEKLIVLSEQMARTVVRSYSLDPARVIVCYPFRTLPAGSGSGRNLAHILDDGPAHVVYSGALGKKQNSLKLFEFFQAAAKEMPGIRFHLFSEGPLFSQLRRCCASQDSNSVQLHELVHEDDLEELYVRSTVQVIPQVQSESSGCFPSKLPNILAAGCPVLAICDPASDLAHFITQASVGAIAVSWDGHELMSKLRLVLDQSVVQKREARQAAVSDMLLTKFSLEKLLDTILGPAPQRTEWVESPVVVP
ncbi:MAG: glycosyltransferase [Candidatus Acidiferrum sp.]